MVKINEQNADFKVNQENTSQCLQFFYIWKLSVENNLWSMSMELII